MSEIILWEKWEVELQMRDCLYGGVPKNPNILESWIRVGTGLSEDSLTEAVERIRTTDASAMSTDAHVNEVAEKSWTGFKSDEQGLYIETRQIKAMLKEASNVIRDILNIKAFRSKIAETVFLDGDTEYGEGHIYLDRVHPDGFEERPVHAVTPSGPITALKRVDYVLKPSVKFVLKVLRKPILDTNKKRWFASDYLPLLFEYASENGLGADRSQERGKFNVIKLEAK